ncbi:MAG: hypothetical protein FWE85_02120, partial [Clostridiales bacterium]|nr:hypothetical protein [Clostridiales bacterium]
GLAEEYGVFFTTLQIRGVALIKTKAGGSDMLNISVSIEKIDWDKLANVMGGAAKKPQGGKDTLQEVMRIAKPFIGKAMETIPPSAIAELFDLLLKDKVCELAGKHGVTVSGVSVKPG